MDMLISFLLPGFVVAAALNDIRSFTIPNELVAAMLACWPIAVFGAGVPVETAAVTALIALMILVIGIGMFAKGLIGAGDIKLLSAVSLYVGANGLPMFILSTALSGAVLALALIMFRKVPLPAPLAAQGWLTELHARTRHMPYGVAIAAGALLVWGDGSALIH